MKDLTGNFAGGLYGLALLSLIAAVVCAFFLHIPQPEEAEVPQVASPRPA
jgi:ACS family tartrate transporter-like MFS transporter